MFSLVREKQKALELRKKGWTYNEILNEVPVAKSSLSLWLKDLPLTEKERAYLRSHRNSNISRGRIKAATSNRENRLRGQKVLAVEAAQEFNKRRWDPLFLVGVALYWGEGSKRDASAQFINSDPEMIRVFIAWLEKFEKLERKNLAYRLFIHKPYSNENLERFWSKFLNVPISCFKSTIFKPTNLGVKKKPSYKGCVRVSVPRSTKLLFKLKVWQNMLASSYSK
jgi:hypothetical protein